MSETRREMDFLGELAVPAGARYGIHTARALENFPLLGRPVHPALVRAFGAVKLAALRTNRKLGFFPEATKAEAMERACRELMAGTLEDEVVVDALQALGPKVHCRIVETEFWRGMAEPNLMIESSPTDVGDLVAGTSTNMNVNEVLANRALELLGLPRGDYASVSPADDFNLHQSTNDTFPTALRIAAVRGLRELTAQVLALQEAFQVQEKALAHVVKVARTELQDAVLTTVGRGMGAYAEALNRDRWRLAKAEDRLRVVNLGGTAIGTGLAAPTEYIFRVVEELRDLTDLGLARAENLVEATQNIDVLVEVSGLLKALATTLVKISGDLRILSSGPEAGLGELRLPPRQAGSSIMPGKVNPVIPEAVTQAAILAMAHDQALAMAAAMGSMELNPFLPLAAHSLLESLDLLARACAILRRHCVEGLTADEARCRAQVENGTASATALLPLLGYERTCELVALAAGQGLRATGIAHGYFTAAQFDELTTPEAVGRLGWRKTRP